MIDELGPGYKSGRVLLVAATDRPGMTEAFFDQGYEVVCGDLMFGLGVPIPVRSYRAIGMAGAANRTHLDASAHQHALSHRRETGRDSAQVRPLVCLGQRHCR